MSLKINAKSRGKNVTPRAYLKFGAKTGIFPAEMPQLSESRRIFRAALLSLAFVLATAAPPRAAELRAWTQFAAHGLEARAIVEGAECPKATLDGRETPMAPRAAPEPGFPNLVCALAVPKNAKSAAVDGRPLPLPPARADRIVLVGDTGCRLKAFPPMFQDCGSPDAWPFQRLAQAAAGKRPDLVIHLGDLQYREAPCPPFRSGCAGSPYGDNWDAWTADFFAPAEALLRAAPFVFVRGNHENCRRNGKGWGRMTGPYGYEPSACRADETPYAVDLGGLTLVVMDVIDAKDYLVDETGAAKHKAQFEALAALKGPLWLAFHKPVFATVRMFMGATVGDNKTLAEAARGSVPANVEAILSGHLHVFETVSYASDFPAQIVAGHGGDWNETRTSKAFDGLVINGVTVEQGRAAPGVFGFAMLERGEGEWLLTGYDSRGEAIARCHLRGRKLACE